MDIYRILSDILLGIELLLVAFISTLIYIISSPLVLLELAIRIILWPFIASLFGANSLGNVYTLGILLDMFDALIEKIS